MPCRRGGSPPAERDLSSKTSAGRAASRVRINSIPLTCTCTIHRAAGTQDSMTPCFNLDDLESMGVRPIPDMLTVLTVDEVS